MGFRARVNCQVPEPRVEPESGPGIEAEDGAGVRYQIPEPGLEPELESEVGVGSQSYDWYLMVRSKVKGQARIRHGTGERWELGVRSRSEIRNMVGYRLQEAGKSRVLCGSSRKSAQLLDQPTQA